MPTKTSTRLTVQDRSIRHELLEFLQGGQAHASLSDAVKDMPAALVAEKPAGSPHSAWQLLEHIRLTLHDLLDFCTNPRYQSPKWPQEYWPADEQPKSSASWKQSVTGIHKELKGLDKLLQDSKTDLTAKIPWGDGQTILREILLAGDHTSYHLGQLVMVRKQLGAWKS